MRGSRSESESEQGVELRGVDPKPDELPMARMKPVYPPVEVRTRPG